MMSTIQYLLIIPAIFLFFLIHSLSFNPALSKLPGPTWARWTPFWRLVFVWDGKSPSKYYELHQKYGPIVRTGPRCVDISDPAAIPIIYGISSKFLKTQFYPIQSALYEGTVLYNMFSQIDPKIHKSFKQPVAGKFGMTSIRSFEPYVDTCTDIFIAKMRQHAGEAVNLSEWLQYYAFDVVGSMTFQHRFGFMAQEKDVDGMMAGIWSILVYAGIVGQVPELNRFMLGNVPLMNFLARCGLPGPVDRIVEITEERIVAYDDEAKEHSERGDFLGWLRTEVEKEGGKMSQRDLFNHLSNNLLAGSDTTAIGLRSVFYFLIKNPRCYAKVMEEIDQADEKGQLSDHVSYEECLKLPYLQAVMKESLRLHPGIGFPLERYVPPEGATICGVDLPGGTIVGVNAHVVHRDKEVFGQDAEDFRPERWLEPNAEHLKAMDRAFFAVSVVLHDLSFVLLMCFQFGGGVRTCIGKNISIMEIGKFVPQVLRQFDLEWASEQSEWDTRCYWMHKQGGLIARLKPRRV